jgi:hypothetical protein
MEPVFLFNILGQCLFVCLKMVAKKVLFAEGFSFDLLLVFENLVDRGSFRVGGLIKFVHKHIVIVI